MATARAGIKSLLKMGDGASPEVFTTIAKINDISGPVLSAKTYDVTSHDNTDGYNEFITGLKDGGEVTAELWFDPTETTHKDAATGLVGVYNANTVKNWQIHIAGTSPVNKWAFAGLITNLSFKYPVDGPQTASLSLKVSGKPTLT